MRKARNSDGTLRATNKPKRLTNRSMLARWVEAETLHLKRLGMAYQAIADHIVDVAQGRQKAMVAVTKGVLFPGDYGISMQAVHRAFRRAVVRLPNVEANELRKLDSERLDEMLLSLQPGIRQGDPRSIEVGVRVLAHKAELNGYKVTARVDTQLNVLVEQSADDDQAMVDLNRLTVEELRQYRRLEAKARGNPEFIEIEPVKAAEADVEAVEPRKVGQTDEESNGQSN